MNHKTRYSTGLDLVISVSDHIPNRVKLIHIVFAILNFLIFPRFVAFFKPKTIFYSISEFSS